MRRRFVATYGMRADEKIDLFLTGMALGAVIGFVLGVAAVLLWSLTR